jgi:metal-responsive CopG/Arc/MetJ family transcriptional regulator
VPVESEGFKGVSIKAELYHEVENFVEESSSYRSVAEFVSEAIRLRFEQLKNKVHLKEA